MDDPFFVRNLVYGTEDSLVSTTGLIVGVASSGLGKRDILVTGGILLLVEALSMAFGAFMSEDSFMQTASIAHAPSDVVRYAAVMFGSYVVAGLLPMIPFAVSSEPSARVTAASVGLALAALYALSYVTGKRKQKRALAMTATGAAIMGLSVAVGGALRGGS